MSQLKKLYLQNSVFKFMISYTVILLLPLFICLIGYQAAFDTVEAEIKDNNLAMINHSKSLIDSQMKAINTLVMQIATNPTITSLAETKSTEDKMFYYDAPKAIESVSELFRHSSSSILEDIYIFLGNTDYIITPQTLYKAQFYYKNILKKTNINFEEWKQEILHTFSYNKYMIDNKDKEISYVQSVPLKYNTPASGAVICEFDEKEIANLFSTVDIENGSYIYIRDENGDLIWSLTDEEEVPDYIDLRGTENGQGVFYQESNNEKMMVLYTISDVNNWRYTLVLPEKVVMHKLANLQTLIFLLFMTTLLMGAIISYYMSIRNGKPLNEIIKQLKGSSMEADIPDDELSNIDNLGGAITKIVSKTQMLKEELEKQQPLLQTAFFQKVIRGEFTTEKEMQLLASRASLTIESKAQRIVACRVFANNDFYSMDTQTLEEVNVAIILIKNTLKELLDEKVHFYDIDHLTTVAIIEESEDKAYSIEKKIKETNAYIITNYHITPSWGISNECASWLEVWRAYEQAKNALTQGIKEGFKRIISYNEIIEDQTKYYYPLAFEQRLITYTKGADTQSIKNLFDILYVENFEKRKLSKETIEQLYDEINSTIIKLTQPNTNEVQIENLKQEEYTNSTEGVKRYFESITQIYVDISCNFRQAKSHSQTKLINKIIEYINEVYADSNLGLGMIASQFNISEGYISSLFKEQTGINFTEYVENLRINKACDLLKDTAFNINDIGEQVGYNSVQSFRRAFKRIHGISPSELRKRK